MENYPADRRNCSRLDELTRNLFRLEADTNVGELEDQLIRMPKARRGSAVLAERAFFALTKDAGLSHLLEVGGNDGRHTRRFLEETDCDVHTFEPNVHAIEFFADLVSEPRLHFNLFGLSDEVSMAPFNILTSYKDRPLDPVNGCSSFGKILENSEYRTIVAMQSRGDLYLEAMGLDEPFALWVDVEGFARQAITGFGDSLSRAHVVICEVEMTDYLSTGSNADEVIKALESHGHAVVFRDFQNFGQCNIVSVHNDLLEVHRSVLSDCLDEFISTAGKIFQRMGAGAQ